MTGRGRKKPERAGSEPGGSKEAGSDRRRQEKAAGVEQRRQKKATEMEGARRALVVVSYGGPRPGLHTAGPFGL